ncbi:putative signaling protein [Zhongshania aliphaticivorans]|uniref:Putative signaling protein n=1 Tax=Zhongshania aliphaticivorans TaxID=1470434 RepID=A0A5S9MYI9_9GAMM|nr:EAL domain-containing protein [Zhongshania aliphaticivorans]CAA0082209.1 putative signaling protein [Zhongshania aliphaticivorans]
MTRGTDVGQIFPMATVGTVCSPEVYSNLYPTPFLILNEKCQVLYANDVAKADIDDRICHDLTSIRRVSFLRYLKNGTADFVNWTHEDNSRPLELRIVFKNELMRCFAYKKLVEDDGFKTIHLALFVVDAKHILDAKFNAHRLAYSHTQQAIYISDESGKVTDANAAFCRIYKYAERDVIGLDEDVLFGGDSSHKRSKEILPHLLEWGSWNGRIVSLCSDGGTFQSSLSAVLVKKDQENEYYILNIVEDIQRQVKLEEKLTQNAEIDPLTGLYNRLAFNNHFDSEFKQCQRSGEGLSLIFIDLDKFKALNDKYGHDYGDELLVHVGQRLKKNLKSADFIARLGGDEFVIIMRGIFSTETLSIIGEKLIATLSAPFKLKEISYQCTSSIGIARYPEDAVVAERLVQAADNAMYQSKNAGRNRCCFFDEQVYKLASLKEERIKEIAKALTARDIKTYFQPVHNLLTGDIIAFEALSRWEREGGDVQLPVEYLPLIENDKLMIELGRGVARQVYQFCQILTRMKKPAAVSMNLSAIQLRAEEFISDVEMLFGNKGAEFCSRVSIEITEPLILDTDTVISQNITRLTTLGIKLTLDSFGKDNSSIYALKQYDFSTVKIDRIFLQSLGDDNSQDAKILTGLIQLLHNLDVDIICEGVETEAHVHFLQDRGCSLGQGWLYSEAMPMNKILEYYRHTEYGRLPVKGGPS